MRLIKIYDIKKKDGTLIKCRKITFEDGSYNIRKTIVSPDKETNKWIEHYDKNSKLKFIAGKSL